MATLLNQPISDPDWLIQELVLLAFSDLWAERQNTKRGVTIWRVQIRIVISDKQALTYKQVRNAFFRLRQFYPIRHVGYGMYWLDG